MKYLADPGKARGCSTNTYVTHSLIHLLSHPLVSHSFTAAPRQDGLRSFSYKNDYLLVTKNFLNPERYSNLINGSKVTAILL